MQETSTPVKPEETIMQQAPVAHPKRATIEFLKQFARVYTFCAAVPAGLGEFIAN